MFSKISLKIGAILLVVVTAYIALNSFIILPKIKNYLYESQSENSSFELEKVVNSIDSKAEFTKHLTEQFIITQKRKIKDIVTLSISILEQDLDEKISYSVLENLSLGNRNDYVYILDKKGKVLLHPNKALEGKFVSSPKELENDDFIKRLLKNTIENGSSYINYNWYKKSSNKIYKKLSFCELYEKKSLIVCSGTYYDEIEENENLRKFLALKNIHAYLKSLENIGFYSVLDNNFKYLYDNNKANIGKYLEESLQKKVVLSNRTKDKISYEIVKNGTKYKLNSWVAYNSFFDIYILYTVYEKDIIKNAQEIEDIVIGFSSIFVILLFILVLFLVYRLLRPINELISNSKLVKAGNFRVRNRIIPNDELGLLSSNFNFMLEKIQDSIEGLENEVQIRTKELEKKVYYDSLTNTLNREAYFRDTKSEEYLTVILIDINRFDDINDLYGFDVGNAVLKEVSLKLQTFAKDNSFVLYKIYGDVFALVSVEYLFSLYHLEKMVEKINLIFNRENIKLTEYNLELSLNVSLGISIAQGNPLKSAGIALRKAKKSDRNFFVYSNEFDTKEKIKETKYWESIIKQALQKDEIVPYFQAIFNKEKQVVKYEALMRIIDSKTKKEIPPSNFMNYAKESKQYIDINLDMIKKVLKRVENIEEQVSINISFKAIQNKIFDNELYRLIENLSAKNCTKIIFEILESEFIKDYEIYENFINKYKRLGIEVAIDDFGSGYSNFKQILKIKPDYLKFDGSIIKDIDKNPDSFQLVKHTVKFAKSVDIKTIAEFVHSEKIYDTLISLGIDEFQGFYLSKPEKDFISK